MAVADLSLVDPAPALVARAWVVELRKRVFGDVRFIVTKQGGFVPLLWPLRRVQHLFRRRFRRRLESSKPRSVGTVLGATGLGP